jgi:hypothetical protein
MAPTSNPRQREPLFDVHPRTGISFEVFYADRTLETFGSAGAGWFWWPRRRGFAPEGPAIGPFPTIQRIGTLYWVTIWGPIWGPIY